MLQNVRTYQKKAKKLQEKVFWVSNSEEILKENISDLVKQKDLLKKENFLIAWCSNFRQSISKEKKRKANLELVTQNKLSRKIKAS